MVVIGHGGLRSRVMSVMAISHSLSSELPTITKWPAAFQMVPDAAGRRVWLNNTRYGKALLDIVNDSDILLQNRLRLENDVAAVRGNVDLVAHQGVCVIHISQKWQSPGNPRQA